MLTIVVGTADMEIVEAVIAYFDDADFAVTLPGVLELALAVAAAVVVLDVRLGGTRFRAVEAAAILEACLPGVITVMISDDPGTGEREEAELLGACAVLDRRDLARLPEAVARGLWFRGPRRCASRSLH